MMVLLLAVPVCAVQAQNLPRPTAPSPGMNLAPTQSNSAEVQGDLFMAQRRYVAAIDSYQSIPDKSAVVWNKTGMAYHHMFALEAARKDYEEALKLNPKYSEALNNLGAVYHGQRDYKAAEHYYKRAIKYDPKSAVLYCNLGTTYFAENNYKQGVKAYQKAFAVDPKVFDPAQGALVESGSSAQQRIAVNYSLAKVYARAGKQKEALEALRKALDCGFKDRKRLSEDAEFASLRQTAEFQQLLEDQHMQ
jgi:tetratricopeptide (TPR) repeat protein